MPAHINIKKKKKNNVATITTVTTVPIKQTKNVL